eukprot:TRINITY_DN810_c0_g1_i1.p1 TRINITY_DN810_c0_g1~~TRINITY_DN810_c0_g1_i1.p1  ORF type:complete len:174 (-),score=30.84 TRINITY_DN810_c0_g1_i1:308-829(-)
METSLRFRSDDKHLHFHAKENFVSEGHVVLQVNCKLNTSTGKPGGHLLLRKKFFPELLTNVNVGAKVDMETKEVTYSLQGKKSWELTNNGLLSLDLKAGYSYQANAQKGTPKGTVELSQKVFNFTEDQDLKIKLGYNMVSRGPYLQLRENNWTLNADLKNNAKDIRWSVAYDL